MSSGNDRKDILGQNADNRFVPIPIRSFVGGKRAIVDLYVKLGERHYTRVVNKNENFEVDQLKKYQDRNIELIYVTREDFAKFAQHSLKVSSLVTASPLTQKQKLSVLARSVEHVYIEFANFGISADSVRRSSGINLSLYKLIGSNPKLIDIIFELSQCPLDLVKHSMATSMFVALIIQTMGWKEKTVIFAALGGLLHDIGLVNLPSHLLSKPRSDMTPEEIKLYDEHPWKGVSMLNQVPGIADEVQAIVLEHHDLPSAPSNLNVHRSLEMYPLSRAVAFADCLADLVIPMEGTPITKDFKSAVDLLEHTRRGDFPGLYFDAARRLLKNQAA
jgi:hypothetical protein